MLLKKSRISAFRQLSLSKFITGENTSIGNIPEDYSSSDLIYCKYAPIFLTAVERCFSRLIYTLIIQNGRIIKKTTKI